MTNKQRVKELQGLVNKELGDDTIHLGSDDRFKTRVIPTGVLPMDDLLQGGVPRGRWTEAYGNYSTLKSFIGYKTIAQCQAMGGLALLVDTEHAWDPEWGESLGIDVDDLMVQHPPTAEKAIDVTEVFVRKGVDLVVWDSVAAMTPQAEVAKREEGENPDIASLARLMSRGMRKLTSANSHTALFYVNQVRDAIGVTFGSSETTPGGRAPEFYASHRVKLQKGGRETEHSDMYTGDGSRSVYTTNKQKVKATLHKSKLTKPYREVWLTYDMVEAEVDEDTYILARGLQEGVFKQKSGWWKTRYGRKSRRSGDLIDWLHDNPDKLDEIMEELFPWRSTQER